MSNPALPADDPMRLRGTHHELARMAEGPLVECPYADIHTIRVLLNRCDAVSENSFNLPIIWLKQANALIQTSLGD